MVAQKTNVFVKHTMCLLKKVLLFYYSYELFGMISIPVVFFRRRSVCQPSPDIPQLRILKSSDKTLAFNQTLDMSQLMKIPRKPEKIRLWPRKVKLLFFVIVMEDTHNTFMHSIIRESVFYPWVGRRMINENSCCWII